MLSSYGDFGSSCTVNIEKNETKKLKNTLENSDTCQNRLELKNVVSVALV